MKLGFGLLNYMFRFNFFKWVIQELQKYKDFYELNQNERISLWLSNCLEFYQLFFETNEGKKLMQNYLELVMRNDKYEF